MPFWHITSAKKQHDRDIEAQWSRYLNGEWTLQKPLYPGWYVVAARDGGTAHHKFFRTKESLKEWAGWFWSVSLPAPPAPIPDIND